VQTGHIEFPRKATETFCPLPQVRNGVREPFRTSPITNGNEAIEYFVTVNLVLGLLCHLGSREAAERLS
jgi:hypothetical protein